MVSQAYQQEVSLTYSLSCSLWFGQQLHGSPEMVIDFLSAILSLPANDWAYSLSVSFWDFWWNHRNENCTFCGTRDEKMLLSGSCLKRKKWCLKLSIHQLARIILMIHFYKTVFEMKSSSITHQLFYPNALNVCVFGVHFNHKRNSSKNIWIKRNVPTPTNNHLPPTESLAYRHFLPSLQHFATMLRIISRFKCLI